MLLPVVSVCPPPLLHRGPDGGWRGGVAAGVQLPAQVEQQGRGRGGDRVRRRGEEGAESEHCAVRVLHQAPGLTRTQGGLELADGGGLGGGKQELALDHLSKHLGRGGIRLVLILSILQLLPGQP